MSQILYLNKPKEVTKENLSDYFDYYAEPKLDGIRTQLTNDQIVKDERSKTAGFPEIKPLMKFLPKDTILDGELCILENPFRANFWELLERNNLQNQRKIKLLSSRNPASFVAFDILQYEGQDVTGQPIEERKKLLESIPEIPKIRTFNVESLLEQVVPEKMEGIVLKKKRSTYRSDWLKYKYYEENDFKVVGVNSKTRLISSLNLIDSKGNDVGTVNYINYPQTQEWKEKVIGMTAKVRSMWTNQNKVRFPVLMELRKC